VRKQSGLPPAAQPAWSRFGENVEPPGQIMSGHNISPVPQLEAQEAAQAEYALRAAEHHRQQVRQSLDFSRGV